MRIDSRTFVLLCVLMGGMGQGVIAPRLPELLGDTSDLALYSGIAASLMYLGMFVPTFRFGRIADEGHAHWLLAPGMILYAVTLLALGWLRNPFAIFFIRLLEGVALSAIFVSADFMLGRLSEESERGKWFAFYGVALSIGLILGPSSTMLYGFLMSVVSGTESAGSVAGSLTLLAVAALALTPRAWKIRVPAVPQVSLVQERLCLGALITGLAYGFLEAGLVTVFPVLAMSEGPLDAESILILVVIVAGVGAVSWGALADHWEPRKVALLIFICLIGGTALAALGTVLRPSGYWVSVYCVIFGFLGGGISPVGFAWLLSETEPEQFGRASGAYLRWYGIGSLIGPAATGSGLQYGNSMGMLAVISFMAVSVLGSLMFFTSKGQLVPIREDVGG